MVKANSELAERTFHSRATISKARTLYVVKGLQRIEIAQRLGVIPATISNWIMKGGWVEERERRVAKAEENAKARDNDENAAFFSSLATQTEELAEDSMQIARDAVAKGLSATRELQQSSQSLKNFVDVYFKAQGLDAKGSTVDVRAELVFRLPGDNAVNVTPKEQETAQDAEPKQLKG